MVWNAKRNGQTATLQPPCHARKPPICEGLRAAILSLIQRRLALLTNRVPAYLPALFRGRTSLAIVCATSTSLLRRKR